MSRNNDLSNLFSKKNNHIRKRHNNYHSFSNDLNAQSDSLNDAENNSPNAIQKKGAEVAMRAAGVPKGLAKNLSQNEQLYELAKEGNFTLKMPLATKVKIIAILIGGASFILLLLFVVLFGTEASAASYGSYSYGQTCTNITVTDTGCDGNAQNCTHIYDGEVEFEDYIAGVVAAEVGIVNNLDYYKVAAIAARSYVLNHTNSSCTVKGNATFQAYQDVEDSSNSALIKQAVEETKGLVLVKDDELVSTYYASACVVNADEDYYYVRYGTKTLGEANFQKIPKDWDTNDSVFKGYLARWYSMIDTSNTDYENKSCPNNHDYGMSQIGALYLITGENYDFEDVIEYYYGEDVEIVTNEMLLTGVDGFVNPTRYIHCSSAFGYRIHPVHKVEKFHSGLDIGIPGGEPIYAAKDGVVSYARTNVNAINNCDYGYGNHIIIDHGDGTSTLYSHMKYGSVPSYIYEGATVSQGEQVGQIGSTGCSTGNHLHYEVRINGSPVDPADYLDLSEATGTCRR